MLLVAAAVLFSTGGAAIKWTTLTAWQVGGMRSLIAAIALLLFLPDARQHWSRRNWLVGIVYAFTLVLFVTANKLTTAANAIFLQATAPLYILLAAPWLLREHIRRDDVPFMLAVGAGMAAFFVGGDAPGRQRPESVGRQRGRRSKRRDLRADSHGAARGGAHGAACNAEHDRVGKPRGGGDVPASGLADHRGRFRPTGWRWRGSACFRSGWRICACRRACAM